MSPLAARTDPYVGARFFVEIDGLTHAGFTECSGLEARTEIFEYKEGGLNEYTHKLPGRTTFANLKLKWGMTDSRELWQWYQDVIRGRIERKNLSVVLYNSEQTEVRRWNLRAAYPVRWIGPEFAAAADAVSIETLELAYHGFEEQ